MEQLGLDHRKHGQTRRHPDATATPSAASSSWTVPLSTVHDTAIAAELAAEGDRVVEVVADPAPVSSSRRITNCLTACLRNAAGDRELADPRRELDGDVFPERQLDAGCPITSPAVKRRSATESTVSASVTVALRRPQPIAGGIVWRRVSSMSARVCASAASAPSTRALRRAHGWNICCRPNWKSVWTPSSPSRRPSAVSGSGLVCRR